MPAVAAIVVVSNSMSWAVTVTSAGGRLAGAPSLGGRAAGARRPAGAPDPPGDGEAPSVEPFADPDGMSPLLRMSASTNSAPNRANVPVGTRGDGRLSRWPLLSARSARAYSARASRNQPTRPMTSMTTPTTSSQPPNTSPYKMTVTAIAATIGRNDGPGMWTPGGGSDGNTTGSVDAVGDVVVLAHRLGAPVEEREDQRGDSDEDDDGPEHQPEQDQEHADRAEDRGERRNRGM